MNEISEYEVLDMPLGAKSIRMELDELRRFCAEYNLPLFTLKVEKHLSGPTEYPLQKPYHKHFTLKWDWCLWAVDKSEEQGREVKK